MYYKITINTIKHLSMKKSVFLITLVHAFLGVSSSCLGEQILLAKHVAEPPVIDGITNDPAWKKAQEIESLDKVSKLPIKLKAVYTDTEVYIQASFPDPDESRTHKIWT